MEDFKKEKLELLEQMNNLLEKYISLINKEKELDKKEDKSKVLEKSLNEPRSIWDWPL